MTITRRLIIRGRVQAVGYRDSMVAAAQALHIAGWVRNRRDGTVEALVQGSAPSVDRIIDWARRGPQMAKVENVDVVAVVESEIPTGFHMLPTQQRQL
ncbi:MAG: acylphosphatase [Burkholderiales bacterium]|nr:acylphosphatase [Burkholderiales bacterium]